MANHAQAINEFVSVTGADPSFAESFLEVSGGVVPVMSALLLSLCD